jgi:hypothetical protein
MRRLLGSTIPALIVTGIFIGLVAIGTRQSGLPFVWTAYVIEDWRFLTGLFVFSWLASLLVFSEDS